NSVSPLRGENLVNQLDANRPFAFLAPLDVVRNRAEHPLGAGSTIRACQFAEEMPVSRSALGGGLARVTKSRSAVSPGGARPREKTRPSPRTSRRDPRRSGSAPDGGWGPSGGRASCRSGRDPGRAPWCRRG